MNPRVKFVRIDVRSWRVSHAQPSGAYMWFDPSCEMPAIFVLDPSLRVMDDPHSDSFVTLEHSSGEGVLPLEGGDSKERTVSANMEKVRRMAISAILPKESIDG